MSKNSPIKQEEAKVQHIHDVDAIDSVATGIVKMRKNPLLVMYYPDAYGQMRQGDVKDVYDEFRRRKWSKGTPKDNLDVLIHTYGGMADVGYTVEITPV